MQLAQGGRPGQPPSPHYSWQYPCSTMQQHPGSTLGIMPPAMTPSSISSLHCRMSSAANLVDASSWVGWVGGGGGGGGGMGEWAGGRVGGLGVSVGRWVVSICVVQATWAGSAGCEWGLQEKGRDQNNNNSSLSLSLFATRCCTAQRSAHLVAQHARHVGHQDQLLCPQRRRNLHSLVAGRGAA